MVVLVEALCAEKGKSYIQRTDLLQEQDTAPSMMEVVQCNQPASR